VLEDRSSAVLALLHAARFCLAHPLRTAGHYFSIVILGAVGLWAYLAVSGSFEPRGYRTIALAFVVGQAFIAFRLGLRLALAGGQIHLRRKLLAEPGRA
jgi:hypothetical protein